MQSVPNVGWGTEEIEECKSCLLLREFLDLEREKREYYEKLLLTRAGILHESAEEITDIENYPSLRHATTLSTLRRMAAATAKRKFDSSEEALEKFELALSKQKES